MSEERDLPWLIPAFVLGGYVTGYGMAFIIHVLLLGVR